MKLQHLLTGLLLLAIGWEASPYLAAQCSRTLTSMPRDVPGDPGQYLSKWDPMMLQPLAGVGQTLSRNNGRQIARDLEGRQYLLIEKDLRSIFLGVAAGPRTVGCEVQIIELVGPSRGAVFQPRGLVVGASMVADHQGRLHIVWCDGKALMYVCRSTGGTSIDQLRKKETWTGLKRLVESAGDLGDVMLDAAGQAAVCYCCDDTVYYHRLAEQQPETAGGLRGGMAPLVMPSTAKAELPRNFDPAVPPPVVAMKPSYPPPMPITARQCRRAVTDLGPDGSVHLAFEREFDIWYARRTPEGKWLPAERAAWGLSFHPAIVLVGDRPLICFQHEGLHKVQLGGNDYLARREGGGASIGYSIRTPNGWRTDYLARAEEIIVNRQCIWEQRFEGKLLPMVEEMGPPVLCRDRHGVAWAVWQNTTRRWAYCARWLGDGFGEVHECRGPFCAPGPSLSAEKLMPKDGADVGLLFMAAGRVLFDRMKIPSLSTTETREVLFLDSLEAAQTRGLQFVVNPMEKHPANPLLSPGPVGSKDDRRIYGGRVTKHGPTYLMSYSYQSWAEAGYKNGALAISADGIHWRKIERRPGDLPPAEGDGEPTDPVKRGYFDNPDLADPSKRFMRVNTFGEVWYKGSKRVVYSADGRKWSDGPEISVLNAIYEGGTPNLWDPLDIPERRIKIYGRVFSPSARSCGMMWTRDLVHWEGAEHHLDPDDPYGKPPANTRLGPLRGQIFLDACAGKGEDQIYSCNVRLAEGLYLCSYWPCSSEHRYEGALAVSRDGFNFTRIKNGSRTLSVGPAGAWDSGTVRMDWGQRDGDRLRLYYGGSAWHHGTEPYTPAWHIGLATIRVHGWTYYTPAQEETRGELTTIPIVAPLGVRRRLAVNIACTSSGNSSLKVEIVDALSGRAVPGYAEADCTAISADGIAVPVSWKAGSTLPSGSPIRLRFILAGKGSRLFSFAFKSAASR